MVTEEIKGNAEFPYELSTVILAADDGNGIEVISGDITCGTTAKKMPDDEDIARIVSLYDLWTDGDQEQTPIEFIKENW